MIASFLFYNNCFSQDFSAGTLNLLDEKAPISHDPNGSIHYLISLKSSNSTFQSDGYKFIIPNQKGFEEFYELKELGVVVSLDTINYKKVEELATIPPCDLHEFFSEKKEIFLLSKNNDIIKRYRIIYKGTEKNIEMLGHGF